MTSWKTYRLGDVCSRLRSGKGIPASEVSACGKFAVVGGNGVRGYTDKSNFNGQCVVVGRQGAYCGNVRYFDGEFYMTEHAVVIVGNEYADTHFLAYLLSIMELGHLSAQSAQPGLSVQTLSKLEISLPSLEEQRRIAGILGAIDDKIENNRRINENLELQAQALYKQWFVDNRKEDWEVGKVSDYYDITIGKTPPRKEKQWFSLNSQHTTWVSISDMGTCGMYISDSSEYLTADAVSRFNIKEVSPNTVLLSFKLTIGRVAISNGIMTTNEAIAHFNTERDYLLEYTYLALKAYEFSNLGSTSSIATAVNSKIIKAMRWIMPKESVLRDFHNLVSPIFRQIKNNILENGKLTTLRDTLLPKLMNGEIKL